ncbi:unnamed protein product, partial [Cyprideis torosa]
MSALELELGRRQSGPNRNMAALREDEKEEEPRTPRTPSPYFGYIDNTASKLRRKNSEVKMVEERKRDLLDGFAHVHGRRGSLYENAGFPGLSRRNSISSYSPPNNVSKKGSVSATNSPRLRPKHANRKNSAPTKKQSQSIADLAASETNRRRSRQQKDSPPSDEMDSRSQGRSRSGTMRSNSERVKHGSLERARPQIDRKRSKDDSDLDFERNDEDFSRRRSRRRDDEPRNHPQPRDISARAQDRIRNRELQRSLNRSETDELFRQELRQRDGGSRSETSRETDPPSSDDIVTEAARRKDLRSRGGSSEDDAHKKMKVLVSMLNARTPAAAGNGTSPSVPQR